MVIVTISRGFVRNDDYTGFLFIVTINGKLVEGDFRKRKEARKAANQRAKVYPNNRVREDWPDGMSWRASKKGWPVDLMLRELDGLDTKPNKG